MQRDYRSQKLLHFGYRRNEAIMKHAEAVGEERYFFPSFMLMKNAFLMPVHHRRLTFRWA